MYKGQWLLGKAEGRGQLKYANGNLFDGIFKNGLPFDPNSVKVEAVRLTFAADDDVFTDKTYNNFKLYMSVNSQSVKENLNLTSITQYPNGDVYEGEWKNCKKNGKGTYKATLGVTYIGYFRDNLMHGVGKLIHDEEIIYEGEFANNKMCGKGIYTDKFYNVYTGHMNDDKYNGKGEMSFVNGNFFDGKWVDGAYVEGTMKYANSEVYVGIFKDGKFVNGKYKYLNGETYEGSWTDQLFQGQGKFLFHDDANLVSYEGMWKQGKMVEKGTFVYKNGDIYIGQFSSDNLKFNGKGKLKIAAGGEYEGGWAQGLKSGIGTMKYADGSYYEGEFANDTYNGKGSKTWTNHEHYEGYYF